MFSFLRYAAISISENEDGKFMHFVNLIEFICCCGSSFVESLEEQNVMFCLFVFRNAE